MQHCSLVVVVVMMMAPVMVALQMDLVQQLEQ